MGVGWLAIPLDQLKLWLNWSFGIEEFQEKMHQPLAKTCVFQLWACTNNIHETSQRSCLLKLTNSNSSQPPMSPCIFPLESLNFLIQLHPWTSQLLGKANLSPKCSQGSGITLVWPFFACKVVLFWVSPGHWRNSFVSLGCEAFWVFFVFLVRGWLGLYIFLPWVE